MTRLRITPKTTPDRAPRKVPGQSSSMFWRNVAELAEMRDHIPPERRAGSGVHALMDREYTETRRAQGARDRIEELDRTRALARETVIAGRHTLTREAPGEYRLEREPLDPQTPAYWRSVWDLE